MDAFEAKERLEETEKAAHEAFERLVKARAGWYITEEFVSLAEHDGEGLENSKADVYDARLELDAATSAWQKAHEEYLELRVRLHMYPPSAIGYMSAEDARAFAGDN